MRSCPAFRLGGEVFFAAAILSFYAPFGGNPRFFWLLSALILAAALAAVRFSQRLPRLALALTPCLAFLVPVSGWLSQAVGAAVLLYAVLVLIRGDFHPDAFVFRREAVWILSISGVFVVISFFWGEGGVSSFWLLTCASLLVLLALRLLRVEGSMGLGWQVGSVGMLGAVLGTGALVGLAVWALRGFFGALVRGLATAFAYFMTAVIAVSTWIWQIFFNLFGEPIEETDPGLPELYLGEDPSTGSQSLTGTHQIKPISVKVPWVEILTVLAAVLLILAAIRFLRSGGLRRPRRFRTRTALETAVALPSDKKKKIRGQGPDNRDRIRLIYSNYLDFLRNRGLTLHGSDTTAEISQTSAALFLETDELLRALYRKARYSGAEISEEEVQAAFEAYAGLLREENLRKNE